MTDGYTKGDALLTIDKVRLELGGKLILRDVSAVVHDIHRPGVEQGQVVCFLGASGIGKTRLSRLIAGLDQPTAGTITLAQGEAVRRGVVGMVPQNYPLFNFLTVRSQFKVARTYGVIADVDSGRKQRELIDQFGLEDLLDLFPYQLSGGQRQRVSIVRQLLCSEHVIVMDEPFSGLDLKMKARACDAIRTVARLHTHNTTIVVTHDVAEGMSVADTVWLMGVDKPDGFAQPGARILEEYDLAAMGLAWRDDLQEDPAFREAVSAVKRRFLEVAP